MLLACITQTVSRCMPQLRCAGGWRATIQATRSGATQEACAGLSPAFVLCTSQVACHPSPGMPGKPNCRHDRAVQGWKTKRLGRRDMKWTLQLAGLACASLLLSAADAWAGPKIVSGPGADPACFKPWSSQTKFFQWAKKPGPYKIALVNGFVGNTWRIQMVKTAKAFAEQPGIKENIKEFKAVSTGTDVAAQLGAMEDFIK